MRPTARDLYYRQTGSAIPARNIQLRELNITMLYSYDTKMDREDIQIYQLPTH